jgi:ABC-type branched-subunit amino acid transport system ATPase component/ABC-type branched-subunit amino acid transport system permease subunit
MDQTVTIFLQFALAGLCFGALYALVSLGIVVIHRGSGVVNFAQGGVGMVGTYLFWNLHVSESWEFLPAFVASVVACVLIGLAIQFCIMYPMRESSPLSRLLATLGVLTVAEASITIKYPAALIDLPSSLPTSTVKILGAPVGEDRLIIIGIVAVLTAVLAVLYKWTRFGRATAAVAENPTAAATLGYSPNRIAAYNWALGSALAGTAGILIAPIIGLTATGLTLIVIPALAAAVVGNMNSFVWTVAAALFIGVAESETTNYVSAPGWSAAVPFVLVLVFLTIRGGTLPNRAHARVKLPSVGSGRVSPPLVLAAAIVGFVVVATVPPAWVSGATTTFVVAMLLLSITVVTGYAGQLSLAQYTLAGLGAYVAGRLSAAQGWPFLACVLIGVLAALPIGAIVGLPALRTRSSSLAIVTFSFGVAVEAVLFDSSSLTGGQLGTTVRTPTVFGLNIGPVEHPRLYAAAVLVFLFLAMWCVTSLRRSATGRRLLSVRANERAAAALGVGVMSTKLYAFMVGAMIASLAGILQSFSSPFIEYSTFTSQTSLALVGDSVIGGLGHVGGTIPGALFQPGTLTSNVIGLFNGSVQDYLLLAGGVGLILVLVFAPNGTAAQTVELWHAVVARLGRGRAARRQKEHDSALLAQPVESARSRIQTVRPKTLVAEALTVRFGGTAALTDVSLRIGPAEIVGLIGPNGAGKTTFIDSITGFVRPSAGRVTLDGIDISSRSAVRRARGGMARSFQSLELFEDMTIAENLLVASEQRSRYGPVSDLFWARKPRLSSATLAAIAEFRLEGVLDRVPTDLSYGMRRLVAIARSIASSPSILLLDEPAAGLSVSEREELSSLIKRLARDWGMGILLIEHDVGLVMRTCDRITVLDFGQRIAEGTPDEVRSNSRVIQSYLGTSEQPESKDGPDGDKLLPIDRAAKGSAG